MREADVQTNNIYSTHHWWNFFIDARVRVLMANLSEILLQSIAKKLDQLLELVKQLIKTLSHISKK